MNARRRDPKAHRDRVLREAVEREAEDDERLAEAFEREQRKRVRPTRSGKLHAV
jgi:hypothetical protein